MKSIIICAGIILATTGCAAACEPEVYYLFRQEAKAVLDSLQRDSSSTDQFKVFVLLHNLAFHNDKDSREKAEQMLRTIEVDSVLAPHWKAYSGSLKMIKVSHSGPASKAFKSISPFGKSPRDEARQGFAMITEALSLRPNDRILRCLRATAAVESAEHLSEMFAYADEDLTWIAARTTALDSVSQFFLNLNRAKYYYKLSRREKSDTTLGKGLDHIIGAEKYACSATYLEWAKEWEARIRAARH